jgi:hypothetical protein
MRFRTVTTRHDFDTLTAAVLERAKRDRPCEPLLAIDECLNHPIVKAAVLQACHAGLATGAMPLWNQRRVRADGSVCYFWGGIPRDFNAPFDVGKPEKYAIWDDQQVVYCLVAQLIVHNVVLLTENIRFDAKGIRRLLRDVVGPKLDPTVSLTGLFKRGKTSHTDYCKGMIAFLGKRKFTGGYREILL